MGGKYNVDAGLGEGMKRMQPQAAWSDVDISAYIDGQLDPTAQSRFEAALEKDPLLQQRVTAMREVVALMQAVPLREPPRNYLLTPAMIAAKPVKRPAPRRPSLLLMRLATSLAAVAFVVTAGLAFMRQGISPMAMVMQSDEAVEAPVEVEVTEQVEALVTVPSAAPLQESAPLEGERLEKAGESQADIPSAPAPVAEFAAPAATEAPMIAAAEAITAPPGMGEGRVAVTETEVPVPPEFMPSPERVAADEALPREATSVSSGEATAEMQDTYGLTAMPVFSWWIPGILGVATLGLAGLTYWISRRR